MDIEKDIISLIAAKGPQSGLDAKKAVDADSLDIWKCCRTSPELRVATAGRRYLRLDRHVQGLARLSPSILREFLTYSAVGLAGDPAALQRKCTEIADRTREISGMKLALARQMVSEIMEEFGPVPPEEDQICFIIAGDIVYDMAHDVPRPERSTGRLVRGSDIDLVVVVDDDLPDSRIKRLDDLIYQKKYRMLINPSVNEEVDYKIKKIGLVREQAHFDTFAHKVACKILQEGVWLRGSESIFGAVKKTLRDNGVPERIEEFERVAKVFRKNAEESILLHNLKAAKVEEMHLFYSVEEFEEFE